VSGETLVDVRGELCPVPAMRVERFLKANAERRPFTVIGDHRPSLESLALLVDRYGWQLEFEPAGDGDWRVRFRPASLPD
jgi:TusA-related sulfurtransferase